MSDIASNLEIHKIVTDLQAEISRQNPDARTGEVVSSQMPLTRVRAAQTVNPHLPIGWPTLPRGLFPKLLAYGQKITRRLLRWYINPIVAQQNAYNAAVTDVLADLQGQLAEAGEAIKNINDRLAGHDNHLQALQRAFDATQLQFQQFASGELQMVELRLQRLENWRRAAPTPQSSPAPSSVSETADTFLLGACFRNPAQMHTWLSDYDDLFAALAGTQRQEGKPASPVLDIGCGRGEFVDHLAGLGLVAYGIDSSDDAVQIGQAQGRDVRQADAFAHLRALADDSLAAVAMLQVIEHFDVSDLLALLKLIAQKLRPGGFVLAETINPTCLYALSNWYLIDPTHRYPMHPQLTSLLATQAGLVRVDLRFLHPVPEAERLEPVDRNAERLNQILYGPQDYALIAFKPEET